MELTNTRRKPTTDLSNMVFGKLPPQAKEIENAVLGACMIDKYAYDTVSEILTAQCFYLGSNQRIFAAMQTLVSRNMPIDLLTVVEQLKATEELEIIGGPVEVMKLTNAVVSGANVEAHSRIVLQKFISREIIRVSGDLISSAYDDSTDPFDLLNSAEEQILQIGSGNLHGDLTSIATVVDKAVEQIEKWRLNEGTLTGVPSGFPELDRATRGWQPGDLIILGARPSVGKTAFALNLVRHAALNKEKPVTVAVWSLEMKSVYLALRMLAAESEMYLHRLQTGRMDDDQMFNLKRKGAEVLRRAPIFFDDSSKVSLKVIRSKARKLKKKSNLGLIVIDYLQLMSGDEDTKGNREQEIARISRGLKNLAQELDVPIIALSQLTRDAATNISWEQSPGISSLRESGSIEQDADLIMMLWGPTENEEKNDGDLIGKRKIKIGKQRNGMLITEVLNFKNEIQLFSAIDQQVGGNFTRIPNDYTQPKNNIDDDAPF
jgi:replicative DNA helicase